MRKVVVTGGLGFIGSHTAIELHDQGYEVIIIDDLSNSTIETLGRIAEITGHKPQFEQFDIRDKARLQQFFSSHKDIQGIIHFAASKAVGESVENPLLYYENNVNALVYLMQEICKLDSAPFIFSSSCTVYGQSEQMPITESAPVQTAASPYGNTKQIGEEIVADSCRAYSQLQAISLRYFNPIGAHQSTKLGELPLGIPNNLVPFITQTAIGKREKLLVFGDDYDTPDGTCIRDYIHVVDLAKAHIVALERLWEAKNKSNFEIFNLGTGKGSSVLDVINSFERVSGMKLNYEITARRAGDVAVAYADTTLANEEMGWKAELSLDDAMRDSWNWEKYLKDNS